MYMPDYGNVELQYKDRLREAARQRARRSLVHAALENARREQHNDLMSRVKRFMQIRNPQQDSTDVRRATAL